LTQEEAVVNAAHSGKAHPAHVYHALKSFRHMVRKDAITSLALPRLETGVGGLAWSEVKPLVEHHLGDLDIPIFLYVEYRHEHAAKEQLESAPA